MPEQGNFSKYLPMSLFAPNEPVPFSKSRLTLPNLWNGIYNAYRYIKEIGIAFGGSERKPITRKPNVSALKEMTDKGELSPFGRTLQGAMDGSQVVDLGCGQPKSSYMPRVVAQLFGAKSYVGVDAGLSSARAERVNEFGRQGDHSFRSTFVKGDMLEFLKSFHREGEEPIVFFIEGIEFDHESAANPAMTANYMRSIIQEVSRISRPGDHLFIGMTVSFLFPAADLPTGSKWGAQAIDPADFGFGLVEKNTMTTADPKATVSGNHYLWVRQ